MAHTLPGVTSGGSRVWCGQYPLRRSTTFDTGIITFTNGSEQRWMNNFAIARFVLEYTNLSPSDRNHLDAFVTLVNSTVGEWEFDLTAGVAATYNFPHCRFMEDSFSWVEESEQSYSGYIRFEQIGGPGGLISGSDPRLYPSISSSHFLTGFPFVSSTRFAVDRFDLPCAARTAYAYYGQGLPNMPSRALKGWELTFSALGNQDLANLEAHFIACGGSYATFAWTDPNTQKFFTKVRYDMDAMDISHDGYELNSLKVKLTEVYGDGWLE